MTRYGMMTSLYLQNGLVEQIDEVVGRAPAVFKSRNQFINAAICEKLRGYGIQTELEE